MAEVSDKALSLPRFSRSLRPLNASLSVKVPAPMAHCLRRLLPALLLLLVASTALAQPSGAPVGVAIAVNEAAITYRDIEARMALGVFGLGGRQPTQAELRQMEAQAVDTLIDEALMMQEAGRRGVEVPEALIDQQIARVAQANRIDPGQLQRLETLRHQVRANIAWQIVMERVGRRQVQVSEEEIRFRESQIRANAGKPEYRLAEILLPATTAQEEAAAMDLARELVTRVRSGASFAQLATQHSVGPGAARGGDLGWQLSTQMEPDTLAVAQRLQPNEVSDPVATADGVRLLFLIQQRITAAADPSQTEISFRRLVLPQDQMGQLRTLALKLQAETPVSCPGLDDIAEAAGSPVRPEPVVTTNLAALPPDVRTALQPAGTGDVVPIGAQILVAICGREGADGLPDRETIANQLAAQKMTVVEQRMLRDLRRSAIIRRLDPMSQAGR